MYSKGTLFAENDHKTVVSDAKKVVKKMNEIWKSKKDQMKTIVLKDGTIVSSTSEERLRAYQELDNKSLKIGY